MLKIVKQYLAGGVATETLARRHGVGHTVLRRWVGAMSSMGVRACVRSTATTTGSSGSQCWSANYVMVGIS